MKKLLKDYLIANSLNIYDDFTIKNIEELTGVNAIEFNEVESGYSEHDTYHMESHRIPLTDIMSWLYSKIRLLFCVG